MSRFERRARKPWVIVAAFGVVALTVWWFALRDDGASTAAATTTKDLVTVTRGTVGDTVSAEGTVAAAQTDDLSFSSAGTVTAVSVKAGDSVTTGEVLATIDSASLQSAVSTAESSLATAQATLTDAQASGASDAQLASDQAAVTTAQDNLATAQANRAHAALVATFDGTVASVDLTVGEQLSSSGSGATTPTGNSSGSGQSSSTLGSSSNSSFPGGNNNSSSNSSSSSTTQISVVSTGRYTVSLPISSSDVSGVKVGDQVTLSVTTSSTSRGGFGGFGGFNRQSAGGNGAPSGNGSANGTTNGSGAGSSTTTTGNTVTGTVTEVSSVADASSGVATFPVTVSFSTEDATFTVGTTVSGAITTNAKADVIVVPTRAVTTTNGQSTVVVALDGTTDGKTETRTVQTGQSSGGQTEIASGLQEGDQVIITTTIPTFNGGTGRQLPGGGGFPGGGQFPGGGA